MTTYYAAPTQVKFRDGEDEDWYGGIAYEDIIICGHCSEVITLSSLELHGGEVEELPWINISEDIAGS